MLRCLGLALLLACHGVSAWPEFKGDKEAVLALKGKPFVDKKLTLLVDEADEAGFLAAEADKALKIAAENLSVAQKGSNTKEKEEAFKNKQNAAELVAEASQGAERKIAMLAIASRKSLREARKSGADRDSIKAAKELAKDSRKKMCEASKIASKDAVKIKWVMEEKEDDEPAPEPEDPAATEAAEEPEATEASTGPETTEEATEPEVKEEVTTTPQKESPPPVVDERTNTSQVRNHRTGTRGGRGGGRGRGYGGRGYGGRGGRLGGRGGY